MKHTTKTAKKNTKSDGAETAQTEACEQIQLCARLAIKELEALVGLTVSMIADEADGRLDASSMRNLIVIAELSGKLRGNLIAIAAEAGGEA